VIGIFQFYETESERPGRRDQTRWRRRKRNIPRVFRGRPCVRSRFDAVEIPLKRTKKSKNALQKLLLVSLPNEEHLSVGMEPAVFAHGY